jgi:hypothetical protein
MEMQGANALFVPGWYLGSDWDANINLPGSGFPTRTQDDGAQLVGAG